MELEQADIEGGMANLLGENIPSEEVVNEGIVEDIVADDVVDDVVVDDVIEDDVVDDVDDNVVDDNDDNVVDDDVEFNFDVDGFNKKYETELTEESLESFISNGKEYDKVSARNAELQQRLDENKVLIDEGFDPLKGFASEDAYMAEQMKKKFPDVDRGILSEITPSKIDEMSNWDVLVKDTLVNNPGLEGGEAGVEEMLRAKYNIDEDVPQEEWTQLQRNLIMKDASSSKSSLKGMYDGIEVPEKIDMEGIRANRIETWNEPLKATVDGINEIKLTEDFSFEVTPDMKQGLQDQVMREVLKNHSELSEEGLREVAGKVRERLILANIDNITKGLQAIADEKAKATYRKKVHNDSSLNDDHRSENGEMSDEEAGMNYLTRG